MAGNANLSQLRHEELIEQAADITMNRFDLDAAQALGVLLKMSQHTGTHMCVVAEAIIDRTTQDKAEGRYILDMAAHG